MSGSRTDVHGFDSRVPTDGLAELGPLDLAVRTELDRIVTTWAAQAGGVARGYAPLLRVSDLARLDGFANFPHLVSLVSAMRPAEEGGGQAGRADTAGITQRQIPSERLEAADYVLPSAACYSVYLGLSGRTVDHCEVVTTTATCFRREDAYDGLRRLLGFTMREIVFVGDREAVLRHLSESKQRVLDLCAALDLEVRPAPATDPFFDPDGSRALVQKLFPVKEELLWKGDLAISSVNFHRNFFGERCRIQLPGGEPAFTGCMAFGPERWLTALADAFAGDAQAALSALRRFAPPVDTAPTPKGDDT